MTEIISDMPHCTIWSVRAGYANEKCNLLIQRIVLTVRDDRFTGIM